ncbi:MAG: ATP-binding protein, partial [Acidobacteriota bacterium]
QLVVQHALDRQEGDARIVNTAGRQRMLSQRLCLLLLAGDLPRAREVADEWEASQRALQAAGTSAAIAARFAQIAGDHRAMLAGARAGDAAATCARQDAFLAGMDGIVAAYEGEARERVVTLRQVELALLVLALGVLLAEGLFVFRPAVRGLRRYLTERERAERQVIETTDREQQRLARDLHDGLSQHLVGIAFLVEALEDDATDAQRGYLDEIDKLLHEAVDQTRVLARGLYSPALEAEGLTAALHELAAHTERVFGVACKVEIASDVAAPPAPDREHLYRIAREAVANAAKHARAQAIEIRLARDGSRVVLAVRDDGVGLAAGPRSGLGLQMMEYRARMLGAVLDVRSGDTGGTVVTCTLPTS